MGVLESNLLELDISTFLRDAYNLGQISFKEIIETNRNKTSFRRNASGARRCETGSKRNTSKTRSTIECTKH
jgi:hypothetical protein